MASASVPCPGSGSKPDCALTPLPRHPIPMPSSYPAGCRRGNPVGSPLQQKLQPSLMTIIPVGSDQAGEHLVGAALAAAVEDVGGAGGIPCSHISKGALILPHPQLVIISPLAAVKPRSPGSHTGRRAVEVRTRTAASIRTVNAARRPQCPWGGRPAVFSRHATRVRAMPATPTGKAHHRGVMRTDSGTVVPPLRPFPPRSNWGLTRACLVIGRRRPHFPPSARLGQTAPWPAQAPATRGWTVGPPDARSPRVCPHVEILFIS